MTHIDADIVIVGSGAAGGVLAATLAEHTRARIVLLEKGPHYTGRFFTPREWDMRVLYADEGRRSTDDGAIPVRGGECVGGGTTVNVALSFDPVRSVWDDWRSRYGLQAFSFDATANDYGVAGLNMATCLAEVRRRINVHTPPDDAVNDNNRALENGCRALGITTRRFALNMRECVRCGHCSEGCAYDAKQGTLLTYVPDAVARGVQLIHHCDVGEIVMEKKGGGLQAAGIRGRVRPTVAGSQPNTVAAGALRVRARLVIVAAGAVESPSLLVRSRHPDPHGTLGRGLVLHPSLPIIGLMPRELSNYQGITGTVYSDHFYASHGFYLECLFGHPVYGSTVLPTIGPEHFEMMLAYRRIAGFGVMLVDSVDPKNRVEWDAVTGKPRIVYRVAESDKHRLRFAARTGIEIMLAAGAEEALLPSEEAIGPLPRPRFRQAAEARYCQELRFEPHRTTITSAHCQATLKMAEDPRLGTLSSRGESHAVRRLVVCDSSAFPTSCGANPMLSIMTLARYQARRIAAEMARYES
jgi:choline dehydrogenase-like flavoprotein